MPSLRAHSVGFAFHDAIPLFSEVSVHLSPGWTGLAGPNGGGKTTLLRVLAGELSPTKGHVQSDPPDLRTVRCAQTSELVTPDIQSLAESTDKSAWSLRAQLHLEPAQVKRWDTLSFGEQKRWQVGAALFLEPEVLFLDEPSNHLDAQGRAFLLSALSRFRGIGLIVSHDRELLDALPHQTLWLAQGILRAFKGGYSQARAQLREQAAQAQELREVARERERRLVQRLHDVRQRQEGANAQRSRKRRMKNKHDHDAASMMMDLKIATAERRLGRQVGVLRRGLEREREAMSELPPVTEELGARVHAPQVPSGGGTALFSFSIAIPRTDGPPLELHRDVFRDTRLWIRGANGAGKSTLLRAIHSGCRIPKDQVLYLPQEAQGEDALALLDEVRALPELERGAVLTRLAALGVDPSRLLHSESPSPGETRKLAIALAVGKQARALLLDEPTNHLDLPSVERLERMLSEFEGALVLVTHDVALGCALSTRQWTLADGVVHEG